MLAIATIACERAEHDILVDNTVLAEGEYFKLTWGGTQVERFHVVAHRGTPDGDVVIASPEHAEPCSLGKLDGYMALQPANSGKYVIGSPSPARIGLFDRIDADGNGRLGFAGVDCKRIPLEVNGINPDDVKRLHPKDLADLSIAVPTRGHTLLLVNPWTEKQKAIADNVTSVRTYDGGLWLIEAGQAVQRDLDGKELARYGTDVKELLPIGDDGDLAFVDALGFFLRRHGEDESVPRDACRVRSIGGFLPQALGYFSPCDGGAFTARTVDGKEHSYTQHVASVFAQDGRLLFTVNNDTTTELWMVSPADLDTPRMIAEEPTFSIQSVWRVSGTKFRLAVKQNGTLALLLVDAADQEHKTQTLFSGALSMSTYEDGIAIVKEDGVLELLQRSDLHVLLREKDVPRSAYRFVFGGTATALAYIHGVDPDTGLGELSLQFLTGEHFDIAKNVREFREVWWPESGLLYASGGAHAAMRFAHVDVPCEKTSDSPWACGF